MSYDLTSNVPLELCIVKIELVILTQLPVCTDRCQVKYLGIKCVLMRPNPDKCNQLWESLPAQHEEKIGHCEEGMLDPDPGHNQTCECEIRFER